MAIKTTKGLKKAETQPETETAIYPNSLSTEELHHLISQRAYALFLQRGTSFGHDLEDWLLAEQEVLGAICTPAPVPVVAKAKRTARPQTAAATVKPKSATARPARKRTPKVPKG